MQLQEMRAAKQMGEDEPELRRDLMTAKDAFDARMVETQAESKASGLAGILPSMQTMTLAGPRPATRWSRSSTSGATCETWYVMSTMRWTKPSEQGSASPQ